MPLAISESQVESVTLLHLKGTLVAGTDTDLLNNRMEGILKKGDRQILLDLGEVNYIDSSGIGALVRAYSAAQRESAALKLYRLTRRVHDVLQITRLSSVFEIYNDQGKAIASFAAKTQGSEPSGEASRG